jgi:5-formyltetrahydrofolate cyclo-ligase
MNQQNDRQRLRAEILAQRDRLTKEQRSRKSKKIAENFWQLKEAGEAECVFVYVNFRSEVETLGLIHQCLAQKKLVTVPYTDVQNKALLPFKIIDPEIDLKPGYCAIPEPDPLQAPKIPAGKIDIAVVPGSVFDSRGGRLGYGGGYYDRFLVKAAPQALRIGFAFELQLVDRVPLEPHDQPLDVLITEERIVHISR